tara:strand:- start:978 stop:2339 length:1362 start_codon:yes stop_codon:yes gene_type:complete
VSKLIQTQEQKLHLSPQQVLEANIIQMNLFSLEKKISSEIENNPALDFIEDEDTNSETTDDEEQFDWEELSSNPDEYELGRTYSNKQMMENIGSELNQKNLTDDIISQLEDMNVADSEIEIAEEILGNLNERGFLSIEPILISDKLNISEKEVLSLIDKIKYLDPPGIGSKNVHECILAQLKCFYPNELNAYKIINSHFDDFTNKRYKNIIRKTGFSDGELIKTADLISVLNPNPAINYFSTDAEQIIPDVIIEKIDNKWHVAINSSGLPSIKINSSYVKMLETYNDNKDVRNFIKKKIDSANWFISAIEQRNKTYKKVMTSIIKNQKEYFNSDNRILSPLILKDIANDIDMDISTVSRVTNGKYVQMPWGIKEMKSFFSEGIKTANGSLVSSNEVKKDLQKIIKNEDKSSPLNDEILTKELNDKGYVIARRTVSKYRESLGISISRLRKEIN